MEDGLHVFVAAATGTGRRRPLVDDAVAEDRSRAWLPWAFPRGVRPPGVGVALGAVAAVVLVVVVLAMAVGAGGPSVDPSLPVAGSDGSGDRGDAVVDEDAPAPDTALADGPAGDVGPGLPSAADGEPGAGEAMLVHVAGAVVTPGVHRLSAGARVYEAIAAAGGSLADADLDRLNLAAPLSDGAQIHVPQQGVAGGGSGGFGAGSAPGSGSSGGGAGPVSLSTADAAALDALPGVGPSTAAAIIAHREANGPFGSVDELLEVRGIGEAKLEGLRDLVVP